MNAITVFRDERFGEVRTVTINNEPWFVGRDVAAVLGYKDTSDALKKHVDAEDKLTGRFADSGQSREMYIINESGLYSLILSSKLPQAKEFKRWVTSVVLPALRKTGGYIAGEERMSDDQLMAQALLVASRKLEERSAQLCAANATIQELAPKAAYYDAVAGSEGDTSFRETAKRFGVPEKKFIAVLIAKGYIYRGAGGVLLPYADHMKRGQFVVREVIDNGMQTVRTRSQTKITPTGRQTIWRMLAKEGLVSL